MREVSPVSPLLIAVLELAVGAGLACVVDGHLLVEDAVHHVETCAQIEPVVHAPAHGRREGEPQERGLLDEVAPDPGVPVILAEAEVGKNPEADAPVRAQLLDDEGAPAGDQPMATPPSSPGTVVEASGLNFTSPYRARGPQDLGLLEAAHPGRVGEHRGGVLRAGGVACRGGPHVGRAELVEHDPGPGRSAGKDGRKNQKTQHRPIHPCLLMAHPPSISQMPIMTNSLYPQLFVSALNFLARTGRSVLPE